MAFISSGAKRTGTILPLASPLGILGRPTFLAFFCCGKISKLLNYGCPHCQLGGCDRIDVKNRHMTRTVWIIGLMHPGIDYAGSGMMVQIEDLHNPFPYR